MSQYQTLARVLKTDSTDCGGDVSEERRQEVRRNQRRRQLLRVALRLGERWTFTLPRRGDSR